MSCCQIEDRRPQGNPSQLLSSICSYTPDHFSPLKAYLAPHKIIYCYCYVGCLFSRWRTGSCKPSLLTPPGPYLSLTSVNAAFSSGLAQPHSAPTAPSLLHSPVPFLSYLFSKEAGTPFSASEGAFKYRGVKKLQHRGEKKIMRFGC